MGYDLNYIYEEMASFEFNEKLYKVLSIIQSFLYSHRRGEKLF